MMVKETMFAEKVMDGNQIIGSALTGEGERTMHDREKVIKKAERIMCSTVDRDMIE